MGSPGKKHFILRIDPALWSQIEELAAQELRSANAQVEMLLREALQRRGRKPPPIVRNVKAPDASTAAGDDTDV